MKSGFSIKVIGLMLLFIAICSQTIQAEEKGGPLRGWRMIPVGGAIVTFEADDTISHSGNSSLKIIHQTPSRAHVYGMVHQRVAVQPDTAYHFSVYVKAKNLRMVYFTLRADWGDRQYLPDGTYDWHLMEYEFVTGENQTYVGVRFITECITEALWIDDIELVEYGTTKNLIVNGGFERKK